MILFSHMFSFTKKTIGIIVAIIFVIGAGYIVYAGRPVMSSPPSASTAGTQTGTTTTTDTAKSYTIADVQAHNTQASCWSTIGGDVYDLTSWITRHPGGPQTIIGLCGTDGTSAYNGQHGNSRRPKAMLILLKIGALK